MQNQNQAKLQANLPQFSDPWATVIVDLPAESIQTICVLFEGYDNLALVRTPIQGQGRVYIYTASQNLELVGKILADIRASVPLTITETAPGMKGLSELWNE